RGYGFPCATVQCGLDFRRARRADSRAYSETVLHAQRGRIRYQSERWDRGDDVTSRPSGQERETPVRPFRDLLMQKRLQLLPIRLKNVRGTSGVDHLLQRPMDALGILPREPLNEQDGKRNQHHDANERSRSE